jgi:hypothetical protein
MIISEAGKKAVDQLVDKVVDEVVDKAVEKAGMSRPPGRGNKAV